MSERSPSRTTLLPALGLALGGLALAGAAWMLPVNLLALPTALLREAGLGTPTVSDLGRDLLGREKLGPAALILKAAQAVADEGAPDLALAWEEEVARQPALVPWGGWDPFLEPLFNRTETQGRTASTPVLAVFVTREARAALAGFLSNSRSAGVRTLVELRQIDRTQQFVPATRPGGQALDATILMTALLYQGEHLSDSLQREVRRMAEAAVVADDLVGIEPFLLDLLSLGKRLDWIQLTEFSRLTDSAQTLREFAHLSRLAADDLAILYAAALAADSADEVAGYLIRYGRQGLDDLRFALGAGQGAVRQLLARQVPVSHETGPTIGAMAAFGLLHPKLLLAAKYFGMLLGAFLVFRGLDRVFAARTTAGALPHLSSGVLAILSAALIVAATEPFLLKAAAPSEFRFSSAMPVLADISDTTSAELTKPTSAMDFSTLLTIGFFAALQVAMYLICLLKIGEVNRRDVPALVKLKLMENEENLFDGGLYVGIGGTATALVFQVLGLIEPNLLAAYSSNLFGITCVALVKIRHVRPYKCKLILEGQEALVRAAAVEAKPEATSTA
ncbi:MAG: hypothetical protein J6386_22950 [Candidatus Synoicihabitans palmerolidicus]|nr:hypothetical protein [Candidatus Synoicihabitans palmerolidicus]